MNFDYDIKKRALKKCTHGKEIEKDFKEGFRVLDGELSKNQPSHQSRMRMGGGVGGERKPIMRVKVFRDAPFSDLSFSFSLLYCNTKEPLMESTISPISTMK